MKDLAEQRPRDGGAPDTPGGLVTLRLAGPFSVRGPDGADLCPVGQKAQALLALLATSPDLARSRRWLQDRLWSDRAHEQGAASLRQALTEIRRALGDHAALLLTDRQKVALCAPRVAVVLDDGRGADFLEGMDVRDPEFENWLRLERQRRAAPLPRHTGPGLAEEAPQARLMGGPAPSGRAAAPPHSIPAARAHAVVMLRAHPSNDALGRREDMFIDAIALGLREALGLQVFLRRPVPAPSGTVEVTVQAVDGGGGRQGVRVQAVMADTGELVWSGSRHPDSGTEGEIGLIRLANELIQALGDALTLRADDAARLEPLVMQRLAARKMWTLDPARMAEADVLLEMADSLSPRGLVKARRAQLRVLRMIECHAGGDPALVEEAQDLCRRALEEEQENSMVLAVVAYARNALDRDPGFSVELARQSVRINPNNPLAWDSLSIAKLYAGRIDEAHEIALKVQRIGVNSPNRFWWDMGLSVTAAVTGQADLALRMAEASATEHPSFRAALRYLVALNVERGNTSAALRAADRLAALEPGFDLDRLALDPDYPVGALRRGGLLRPDRIRAIRSE